MQMTGVLSSSWLDNIPHMGSAEQMELGPVSEIRAKKELQAPLSSGL